MSPIALPLAKVIEQELDAVADRREDPDWEELFGGQSNVRLAVGRCHQVARQAERHALRMRLPEAAHRSQVERVVNEAWRRERHAATLSLLGQFRDRDERARALKRAREKAVATATAARAAGEPGEVVRQQEERAFEDAWRDECDRATAGLSALFGDSYQLEQARLRVRAVVDGVPRSGKRASQVRHEQVRTFEEAWREETLRAAAGKGPPPPPAAPAPPPPPPPQGGAPVAPVALETKGQRDQKSLEQARKMARESELTGLALSGGGIRSATFCLGILQGLADLGLLKRFDYLSTVSGGGFIGSWLAAWIKREGSVHTVEKQLRGSRVDQAEGRDANKKPVEQEPGAISHLRSFSNYLSPRMGLLSADSWVLLSSYLRNFILNQLLIICALMSVLILPRLGILFYDWSGQPRKPAAYFGIACALFVLLVAALFFLAWALRKMRRTAAPLIQTGLAALHWLILTPLLLAGFLVAWFAWENPQILIEKLVRAGFGKLWWPKLVATERSWLRAALSTGEVFARPLAVIFLILVLVLFWRRLWYGLRWALSATVAVFVGAGILGAALYVVSQSMTPEAISNVAVSAAETAGVLTFGPPVFLLAFVLGTIVHVGLMGSVLADAEREWWGSLGGYLLQWAAVWVVVCGLALFGVPLLILAGTGVQAALTAGWVGTSVAGVLAGRSPSTGQGKGKTTRNQLLEMLAQVAPYVFVVGLIIALSALVSILIDDRPSRDVAQQFVWETPQPATPATHVKQTAEPDFDDGTVTTAQTREYDLSRDETQVRIWSYWAGLLNTHGEAARICQLAAGKESLPDLLTKLVAWLVGLGALALLLSWRVGANTFSLHALYGNRLTRCYLGASRNKMEKQTDQLLGMPVNVGEPLRRPNPVTGFDPLDDMPLHELRLGPALPPVEVQRRKDEAANDQPVVWPYRGPYLLVNTALNLVHGDELAYQERMAEAFLLSPAYCGSKSTDYQPLPAFANNLSLGDAVATSGAAASPNMGYHSSPAVTALLTLFNVRVGAWLGNPCKPYWTQDEPKMSLFLLFKELFGRTNRHSNYVYLSDGGHFENLGVYELVRRQCRFIIVLDGDQDGAYAFDDLGGLIRKCRSDLGVPIDIDVSQIKPQADGYSKWHCAVGRIGYDSLDAQAVPGILVYVKTSLTGDEPSDVLNYATSHPDFPHQSTADQFFNESQFESHRALGYHIAHEVFGQAMRDVPDTEEMTDAVHRKVVRKFFANVHQRWFPPPPNLQENYLESVKACMELEVAFRKDKNLAHFSWTLFPEARDLQTVPPAPRSSAEKEARTRAEVHAVSQMLQVMEDAFMTVRLEGYYAHPLNRGWMSAFRRWSTSEVFREHWLTLRGEFSKDFVRFCEEALKLDRGTPRAYHLAAYPVAGVNKWTEMGEEFHAEWPKESQLDDLVRDAQKLAGEFNNKAPVWLLTVERSTNQPVPLPSPVPPWLNKEYACGIVLVTGDASAKQLELLVWLRGAYRNTSIGRKCLDQLLRPEILEPLRTRHSALRLQVRLPGAERPGGADKMQKEMWQDFFFDYRFRKADDSGPADLILCRMVAELLKANP